MRDLRRFFCPSDDVRPHAFPHAAPRHRGVCILILDYMRCARRGARVKGARRPARVCCASAVGAWALDVPPEVDERMAYVCLRLFRRGVSLSFGAGPGRDVAQGGQLDNRPYANVCHLRRDRSAYLRRRRAHRHGKVEDEYRRRHHDVCPLPRRSAVCCIFLGECRV